MLRKNLLSISKQLSKRGFVIDIERFNDLESKRKNLQIKVESLLFEKNSLSKKIGIYKINGKNIDFLLDSIRQQEFYLDKIKNELKIVKEKIKKMVLNFPNILDKSVPFGINENDNIEINRWGNAKTLSKNHIELGKAHGWLDFSTASCISGSRFVIMKGEVARLHRALSQFMLDLHIEKHGYLEVYVPYLVNYKSLYGTAQLPKFKKDLFYVNFFENDSSVNNKYALIPTAEVPLVNMIKNKIFKHESLPIKFVSHSPCFRAEAGSYGKYNKGMIRLHQFDKVELVQIVSPRESHVALENITEHAENVLRLLELPYRKVILCSGEIGFSSYKTYDLEVWLPSKKMYCEISSCSNTLDFQSRRIMARYYDDNKKLKSFVHILNASGLAVGRTLIAIMENYQLDNGKIFVPKILRPYMSWKKEIG